MGPHRDKDKDRNRNEKRNDSTSITTATTSTTSTTNTTAATTTSSSECQSGATTGIRIRLKRKVLRRSRKNNKKSIPSPPSSSSSSPMSATSPLPSPSPAPTSLASSIAGFFRLPMLASGGLAVAATGMLYFKQNELIYPRNIPAGSRTEVFTPDHFRIPPSAYERIRLTTPDGEFLDSFLIKPLRRVNYRHHLHHDDDDNDDDDYVDEDDHIKHTNTPRITIVMFHGNAGNIGHRIPIAEAFAYNVGCNVFMVEYRGYGASTGSPDEKGIKIDAQTALNYLLKREDTRRTKIVVFGQSLGGAVSSWLSVNNQEKIAAVILENTFLSLRKMVPSFLPAGKYIAWLCHQIWATEASIHQLKLPVLFLSGLKDEIVPPHHMAELYNLCGSDTKIFRSFPNGSHNETVVQPGYVDHICQFLEEYID